MALTYSQPVQIEYIYICVVNKLRLYFDDTKLSAPEGVRVKALAKEGIKKGVTDINSVNGIPSDVDIAPPE